ncbi:MAG: ATP-binding protein [Calditrichaeota bacterium]|nr:ATP-binding protein [Calditrichota bacterium]
MEKFKIDVSFSGKRENIRIVSIGVHDLLQQLLPNQEKFVQDMELCLTEGLSNVLFHAHQNDSRKKIRFQIIIENECVTIRIFDSGPGFLFDPKTVQLPGSGQSGGRGLFIISRLMDEVEYKMNRKINYLQITKRLNKWKEE